jgi:dihydrofolate synthase/folylpolyglutamate synthase
LAHQVQVHPQTIDLGLDRVRRVLERLGWRQPTVPVITVAGTNGKGSVSAYCAALWGAAGYRVGVFTSPHLRDYRERIQVHDRPVTTAELLWAFARIEAACMGSVRADGTAEREISLTFFEYNAVAAFLVFEAAKLDGWVLEVGMGGRLDAVNAVDATLSVVVSIGFDHQEFLGDTLAAIAREKAGIMRHGRIAVLGSREPPPALLEAAAALGALPKRLGFEFDYRRGAAAWHYRGRRWDLPGLPEPALPGDTQFDNAATALAAVEELDGRLPVTAAAVARALGAVRLAGRFQVVAPQAGRAQWILDVAHNPQAARVLKDNLRALPPAGKTLAVCGILADKDAAAIVRELRDCFDAWWFVSTEGARGSSGSALKDRVARCLSVPLLCAAELGTACAAASAAAGPADRIVVFGSFHTVGPALDWLESQGLLPAAALPEYTDPPRIP